MINIKLRVWDKLNKRLGIVSKVDYDRNLISYKNTKELTIHIDDCIIMRYIGQDKFGKDVYEYDKLIKNEYPYKSDDEINYIGVVDYLDSNYSFYLTKRLINPKVKGISDGISEPLEDLGSFELVGNEFEESEYSYVNDCLVSDSNKGGLYG